MHDGVDDGVDDGRGETPAQRTDRNWSELLQELRVLQTGIQLLTGFLLTLPFQQRFSTLTGFQRDLFLVVVLLSATSTGLLVAPVGFHRAMFRRGRKRELVDAADRFAELGLAALGATLVGVVLLVVDVVAGRTAGAVAAAVIAVLVVVCWWLLPIGALRRADRRTGS